MSDPLQINTQMPFMWFNWSLHSLRVGGLTLTERGLFDAARTQLWSVVDCKMPRTTLLARLRIKEGSRDAKMLDQLVTFDLLAQDQDGLLYDPVQVEEFAAAVRKAEVNRANGSRGGRPRKSAPSSPAASDSSDRKQQPDDGDF